MSDERRELGMELVWAALGVVNPMRAVTRHVDVQRNGSGVPALLQAGGRSYDLTAVERVVVVGAGKASAGMGAAIEALLGQRISAGWINVRRGYEPAQPLERIEVHSAGHPLPDGACLQGTRRILNLLRDLGERDLALVLLSGGASALLVQPIPQVSLGNLRRVTNLLLESGANIEEVNAVRKHLSQVKGGRLAQEIAAAGARALVLVLSDVVGNPLDAIGSGPCAPDLTTFADAWAVLERYDLLDRAPEPVCQVLQEGLQGEMPETPKPGDALFERVHHLIVGDNRTAAEAAAERARALDFHTLLLTTFLEGEAREVGQVVAGLAKEEVQHNRPLDRPACLILGGETTVTVRGSGKGGRNQEVALGAALALSGWEDVMVVALATDGTDGPTDAAGAIATGETVRRARAEGLDPVGHLARNDAYPLFSTLGDLIMIGPTGTNVNDLIFVLAF